MHAAPAELERPVGATQPLAVQRQQRRCHAQIGEADRSIGIDRQRARHHRQPTGQRAQEAVIEPPHRRPRRAADAQRTAGASPHFQIGQQIDAPQPGNLQPRQRPVEADQIIAGGEVRQHRQPAVETRRAQPDQVRCQHIIAQLQHSLGAETADNPLGQCANPAHPIDAERQRDLHNLSTCDAASARLDTFQSRATECQPRCAGAIVEARPSKCAIKPQRHPNILPVHIIEQQPRPPQPQIGAQRAEPAVGQIDPALGIELQRRPNQVDAPIPPPLGECPIDIDRQPAVAQPVDQAVRQHQRGIDPARRGIAPVTRTQPQPRQRCAFAVGHQRTGPALPVALTTDDPRDALLQPRHRRQHAAGRRDDIGIDIEIARVRSDIQIEHQPVVAVEQPRVEIDIGLSAADIGAPGDARNMRLTDHGSTDVQPRHVQPPDMDIEVRQDRCVLERRHQLRQPRQPPAWYLQRADIQLIGEEEIHWPPIDPRYGNAQKFALGVEQPQVADRRMTIDRPLDPSDTDAQPALGRQPLDAVDDEPLARCAVDDDRRQRDQSNHANQRNRQPFQQPHRPRPAARHNIGRLCCPRLRHQKACPRLT